MHCVEKQRHYSTDKGPYAQDYSLSSNPEEVGSEGQRNQFISS